MATNRFSGNNNTEALQRFLEFTEYQSKSFVTVMSRATYGAAPTTVREAADFGAGGLAGIVGVRIQVAAATNSVLLLSNTVLTGVTITTIPNDAIAIVCPSITAISSADEFVMTWPTAVTRRYCGIVTTAGDTSAQFVIARVLLNTDFDATTPKLYGMVTVAD